MRSVLLVLATACLGAGMTAVASAAEPPPGAAISDSLEYVARVPDSAAIVEGKFDRVGGRDVLVTTGRYGFRTYDVSDPTKPELIGSFQPPEVLGANGYWQGEDMEIDVKRQLIIRAPDPRRGDGRPIWVTDLRDPKHPKTFPNPIDLGRNDGLTDYSHDVDVDAQGFAWVSGRGGLTGYATHGKWRDPKTDSVRRATPWDPVLVAGGGLPGGDAGVAQPQTDFIHNSTRPVGGRVQAAGVPKDNIALMTEEDFTTPCDQGGRIVAADITSSLGGER